MLRQRVRVLATATAIVLSATGLSACATSSGLSQSLVASSGVTQVEASPGQAVITRQEVEAAQDAWGKALVQIATTYDTQGLDAARTVASGVIDAAYGYNLGPVLFKPTLTVAPQTFRTTRDGALAYFVGQDPSYPADTGFALKGWRNYEIVNAAVFVDDDVAISMGKVRLTDKAGNVTEVDKTWGWKKDSQGKMRIVLHHSSLPYSAK